MRVSIFFNLGAADLKNFLVSSQAEVGFLPIQNFNQLECRSLVLDGFFYSGSGENIVNALCVSVTTSCGNTRTLTELEHLRRWRHAAALGLTLLPE